MPPTNRNVVQKPKNMKKSLIRLLQYSKKYYALIILSVVFALISSILYVFGPSQLKQLTNIIASGVYGTMDFDSITRISIILAIIYIMSEIFSCLQNITTVKYSQNISKNLRTDIDRKIHKIPLKYVDSNPHGEILSKITNDVDTINQGLSNSVTTLTSNVATFVATLVFAFLTNWILALVAIGTSLLGFLLIALIMSKSQKYFMAQQNGLGEINGHIEEIYSGQSIIKVYNATDEEHQKFSNLNKKLYTSAWKSQFLGGIMMPLMNFIGNFSYVAVCVVGAVLVKNGSADIGTITAFIMYNNMLSSPLSQIAQAFNNLQSSSAASERTFEFLDQTELEDESDKQTKLDPQNLSGDVVFTNVSFGYDKDKTIIHDFSLYANHGQKVAIVGSTGAGKTTIVNLLMRFYEIDGGSITIDGVDTKQITRKNVHDLFGMVLQDTWLFDGTIRENLVFNKQDVSEQQLDEVCKECGLDHFISTLPKGYDSRLDENTTVSSGQKQLLTIARAMIQNSPMMILDEATSNVDTRTEILIQQAMDKLSSGRTSFVIAHRLSTIKNADVIVVMKDGNIIEKGTHESLLQKNGEYAKLYKSQFEND